MMRYGLLASVFLFFSINLQVMAETDKKPCAPLDLKSENKEIVLPGPDEPRTSKLYIFKNLGTKSIWLDHPVLHPSVSAGWSSYLRPGNSSALWVNRKNFNLSCAVIAPGKLEYLDCVKVVSVCAPKDVVYQTSRKGTWWLAEDKPSDELMKTLAKRGVLIKVM